MLGELVEWFRGFIEGQKELLDHVERLKELAEQCETLEEFKQRANEYISGRKWFEHELRKILEVALSDAF